MTGVFPDIDTRFRYLTGKKKKKKGACEMELSSLPSDRSRVKIRGKALASILEYYEERETHMYPLSMSLMTPYLNTGNLSSRFKLFKPQAIQLSHDHGESKCKT